MGNRMTVERPYIIDDYPSDDDEDDDDDDYFNYETAYDTEGADNNLDEEDGDKGWTVKAGDDGDKQQAQVSVNSQVVSSLVKEVETLLSFLDKEDYEGAQRAARVLKEGGGGGGESRPLLPKNERISDGYSNGKEANRKDGISMDNFGEEALPLLSPGSSVDDEEWTRAQRQALQKLDRDLTSFEENESRVVTDSGEEANADVQPRRKRKSSLPRLKRVATLPSNGSDATTTNGSSAVWRSGSRSRESSLTRSSPSQRMPRSPASGIPRFCYKASTTKSASAVVTTPSTSTVVSESPSVTTGSPRGRKGVGGMPVVAWSAGRGARKSVDEAITSCVKGFTSQTIPDTNPNFRGVPILYAAEQGKRPAEGDVVSDDAEIQAWEINISEMSGRVKQNKKRSGIPSLWTHSKPQPASSGHPPSSPDVATTTSSSSSHTADSLDLSPSSLESMKTVVVNSATQTLLSYEGDHVQESNPLQENDNVRMSDSGLASMPLSVSVDTSRWDLSKRKVFDQRRWDCISRPQYKTSCGISSVVSSWNYLFSTLGYGHLHPLSQEDAMTILGFEAPFDNIKFGPTTGNITLMRWFQQLNSHFKVTGQCYFMYKPCGRNRTFGVTSETALEKLKSGLQTKNKTYIYHCHNHYFCPIGFEDSPLYAVEAYNEKLSGESLEKTWILIGDTSRKYGPFHCKSWEDICMDLNCEGPDYFNIRQSWLGMMKRAKVKKAGGNLHCILCFQATESTTTMTDQNQHNLSDINLLTSFHLHPQQPPPQPPNSSLNSSQDGDGGSNDCDNQNQPEDVNLTVTLTPCSENGSESGGEKEYWKTFEDGIPAIESLEEEEEIESVSSEDLELEEDKSSNYDADSLS